VRSQTVTKNGHKRTLPLKGRIGDLIEQRWRERAIGVPWVFHRAGRPVRGKILRRHFRRAVTAAKLEGLIFHDLRRSAVRNMVRAGVSPHVAMAISGHRSPAMFRRYDVVNLEDVAAGLERAPSRGQFADNGGGGGGRWPGFSGGSRPWTEKLTTSSHQT
jgi:integrase